MPEQVRRLHLDAAGLLERPLQVHPLDLLQVGLEIEPGGGYGLDRVAPPPPEASRQVRRQAFGVSSADCSSATPRSITFSSSRTLPGQR